MIHAQRRTTRGAFAYGPHPSFWRWGGGPRGPSLKKVYDMKEYTKG